MIQLRDVLDADLKIFFEQERDREATLLAAFPPRDTEAFAAHWIEKREGNAIVKTIVFDGEIAGSIDCWQDKGRWLVGYWIGREYWGKGIATAAVGLFLKEIMQRPLYAQVASHNRASIRVLEKCGFTVFSQGTFFSEVHGEAIDETTFVCQ